MRRVLSIPAASAVSALCALAMTTPAHAITNGDPASEAYAFMGSVQYPGQSPRSDKHGCGATLISDQWMVTAGHCLIGGRDPKQVRIGSSHTGRGGELAEIDKTFPLHPTVTFGSDVGLIKLKKPVEAKPVTIADNAPAANAPLRVLGWGETSLGCTDDTCWPKDLRELDTKRLPSKHEDCEGLLEEEICVGSVGEKMPSNMDSGGPALTREDDGTWRVVGATSGPSWTERAVGYTDVTAFRTWIKETIAANK